LSYHTQSPPPASISITAIFIKDGAIIKNMPMIYLANGLYNQIVRMGENPTDFVKKAVIEKLENVKDVK